MARSKAVERFANININIHTLTHTHTHHTYTYTYALTHAHTHITRTHTCTHTYTTHAHIPFSCECATCLDVPVVVLDGVEGEVVGDFRGIHGPLHVLLVGEDEDDGMGQCLRMCTGIGGRGRGRGAGRREGGGEEKV